MKRTAAFAVGFALACITGCSSGSGDDPLGPEPDLASIEAHFQNPDGTFNEGNAQRVVNGQGTAAEMNMTGGATGSSSSGTSSKQSALIHILDTSSNRGFACDALQQGQETGTCACPDGGSFTYAVRSERTSQATDIVMRMKLDACTVQGTSIDGRQWLKMHVDQSEDEKLGMSMLFVIDANVTTAGETKSVVIEQRLQNGVLELAIKVDDGWVVVRYESGGAQSGKLVVRDRRGTWTCVATNGHGECTNDKGETQKF